MKRYIIPICLLLVACGALKRRETSTTIIKDSVAVRHDTIKIEVPERLVQSRIDTLVRRDTVVVSDKSSLLKLKYWRDEYGKLMASCEKLKETIRKPIEAKTIYKTIEKERVVTVEKKSMPLFGWITIGALSVLVAIGGAFILALGVIKFK